MKETYERCVEVEEKKSGLVIVKSLYGKLHSSEDGYVDYILQLFFKMGDSAII